MGGEPQQVKITAAEFGAKFSGKTEVWRFLQSDCGAYLDSYDTMTVWHLKDLSSGQRKRINGKSIMHIGIPQFAGLTVDNMLDYIKAHPQVSLYLPIEKEIKKLSRQYIGNIIYTVVGDQF